MSLIGQPTAIWGWGSPALGSYFSLAAAQHVQVGGRTNAPCYYWWEFWTELSCQISRVSQVWRLIGVAAQAEFQPLGYHRKMPKVHPGSDALVLWGTSFFAHSRLADGLFWSCPLHAFLHSITSFLPSECTYYIKYVYLSSVSYLTCYMHLVGIKEVFLVESNTTATLG